MRLLLPPRCNKKPIASLVLQPSNKGLARQLYENGWITYMRTDSHIIIAGYYCPSNVRDTYGDAYLPAAQFNVGRNPRTLRKPTKQFAHQEQFRSLEEAVLQLDTDQMKLYRLIWCRTMASQMKPAKGWAMFTLAKRFLLSPVDAIPLMVSEACVLNKGSRRHRCALF